MANKSKNLPPQNEEKANRGINSMWLVGLLAISAAVVANLLVRAIIFSMLELPADFPPLQPVSIAAFTLGGTLLAAWVFVFIRKRAKNPVRNFRWIALVALIVSIVPNFLLMANPGLTPFPGGSTLTFGVLTIFHVVAAFVSVSILTGLGKPGNN